MSGEPQVDDPNSRRSNYYRMDEFECFECGHSQAVEVVEEYSHNTTTWDAQWVCLRCGEDNNSEGWYEDDDL
jgi:transcription elongation factor Elf1